MGRGGSGRRWKLIAARWDQAAQVRPGISRFFAIASGPIERRQI